MKHALSVTRDQDFAAWAVPDVNVFAVIFGVKNFTDVATDVVATDVFTRHFLAAENGIELDGFQDCEFTMV